MAESPVFQVYTNIQDGVTVVAAAKVTDENLDAITEIIGGRIATGLLTFPCIAPGFEGVAEIGDYIVSDLAGGYIAVDKEMFEAHYASA